MNQTKEAPLQSTTLSSLARTQACPGSDKAAAGKSDPPGDAAIRGTALHRALELMLLQRDPELDEEKRKECLAICPDLGAEDWDDAATVYWQVMARKPKEEGAQLLLEYQLKYAADLGLRVYQREDGSWSNRLDVAWVVPNFFAIIDEAKFGRKAVKHPKDNPQTKGQAVCLARDFNLQHVVTVIHQPLNFARPEASHYMDEDALELAETELRSVVHQARQPDAPLAAGEHCDWCPARHSCPARSAPVSVPDGEDVDAWFGRLAPEARASTYQAMRVQAAHAAEVVEKMEQLARTHPIRGWAWVPTSKRTRVWANLKEARKELKALAKQYNIKADDIAGATPTRAEKLLPNVPEVRQVLKELVAYDVSEGEAFQEAGGE